jgi:RHS repeat-associated protein
VQERVDVANGLRCQAGTWVSLGSFSFSPGLGSKIVLSDQANNTVGADAVKLVRDNSTDAAADAAERKAIDYAYDPNGNLRTITDSSPGAAINNYDITYTGLNQVDTVTEKAGTTNPITKHTTSYTYDPNGNPDSRTHDNKPDTYTYNDLDQLTQVKNAQSASDPAPKVTTFTYTPRGQRLHEVKANGNTVDYDDYFLDGLLRHQIERKPGGTLVSEHTLDYDPNGNRKSDTSKTMNADNHAALIQRVQTATYDPRDRIATLTKTDPTTNGTVDSESYVHDANDNVISQTITNPSGTTTTTYTYDRNRLQQSVAGGSTANYNYDPWGRLDSITSGTSVLQRNLYDGFDRVSEFRRNTGGGVFTTTRYGYDPLDRTASKTDNAGTTNAKTTNFNYLGLSEQVVDEQDTSGQVQRSYRSTPWGELLSQTKRNTDGSTEDAFYSFDPHSSVEALTDTSGDTKATYGYTAYGQNDTQSFTGVDKPDPQDPTKQPYNFYRYTAKRFDPTSGHYDLGFRDYDPGLNRFLTRDLYNGALDDLNLATDPFTNNRYSFAAGNPTTMVDLTGHNPVMLPDGYATRSSPVSEISTVSSFRQEEEAQQDWAQRTANQASSVAGSGLDDSAQQPAHAPCGSRDWAEGFHNSPFTLDFSSDCLAQLMASLGPGMPSAAVAGTLNFSGGPGGGGGGQEAEGQVAYESTDLSKMAALYRLIRGRLSWPELLNPKARRDVVIFEYKTKWGMAYAAGVNEPGGKHAEQVVWEGLERQGVKKDQVTRIYSELQPCPRQVRNCSALVKSFPNAKVTWSFNYGATTASRRAGVSDLEEAIRFLSTGQPRFPF